MKFQREQFDWQKEQAAKSSSSGGRIKSGSSSGSSGKKSSSSSSSTISKKTTRSKSDNQEPTVDMDSVLDLGFGPISESKLNELVESGVVEEYVSDNKIKFRLSEKGVRLW